jgi:putative nucleotidyltransferase with HDIG domain
MECLRTHPGVTAGLIVLFVAWVVVMMRAGAEVTDGLTKPRFLQYSVAGALLLAMVIHLRVALLELMEDNRQFALLLGLLAGHLGLMVAVLDFGHEQGWSGALLVMTLPHAIAPLTLSLLLGRKAGLFAAIYVTFFGALIATSLTPLTFIAASSLIGFASVALTQRVRKRSRIFNAGLLLGAMAGAFAALLYQASSTPGAFGLGMVIGLPLLSGVLAGMMISGLLPVLEAVFGVTTEITWLELSDLNHPLLRRMSLEAPGSYHHSLMVASLSEAAAESIGADATMCRVCSYFHDVGKLTKPEYFIENGGIENNPHNSLTPRMSALVLIAHVKDGVDLGIKHNLNSVILDVIEQHHGTTLTHYFYQRALKEREELLKAAENANGNEDDVPQVSEDVFRYPGPKPQFKESAIISLADALESASRSLEKPSASRVEALIDAIVQHRVADGQLDECDLTIAELARVKASFAKTLLSMMHGRVKYGISATEGGGDPVQPSGKSSPTLPDAVLEASFPIQGARRQGRTARTAEGSGRGSASAA